MTPVQDVARTMRDLGVGSVFVTDDERLVGVVTDRDLAVRVVAPARSPHTGVEAVMTKDPVSVDADADIMAAYRAMRERRVGRIPVVHGGRLVGVVTFDDLFWLAMQRLGDLVGVVDEGRDLVAPLRGRRPDTTPDGRQGPEHHEGPVESAQSHDPDREGLGDHPLQAAARTVTEISHARPQRCCRENVELTVGFGHGGVVEPPEHPEEGSPLGHESAEFSPQGESGTCHPHQE
ncbi:CBS domain-containing protein [Streptomyces sp. TRM66268-LWL]|uniref:CBS domain-containing protein n=2 Tax=Streptomyces polyasparticus TaxID=2767826 RepID=A0ABR7SHX0_9ACTN|nr:CBS domain-containing protein [Streptomyces polyasparticus]